MTRSSCSGGLTPRAESGQRVRSTTGRAPTCSGCSPTPGSCLPTVPVPFVPVPLARARTVRRREPVPVATGKRWSSRRRSALAGAATVALVRLPSPSRPCWRPGGAVRPPRSPPRLPILRAVSTSESAGTVLGRPRPRRRAAQTATPSDLRRVSYEHWSLANRINGRTVTVAVGARAGAAVVAARRLRRGSRASPGQTYFPSGGLPPGVGAAGRPEASGTRSATRSSPRGSTARSTRQRPRRPGPRCAPTCDGAPHRQPRHRRAVHRRDRPRQRVAQHSGERTGADGGPRPGPGRAGSGQRHRPGRARRYAVATDSSFTGLPVRYVLVFDPHTGCLLWPASSG